MVNVKVCEKLALTIEEAAAYSNIGINTLRSMLKHPECKHMIIYIGNKKLIKREPFEKYIASVDHI